MKGLVYLPSLLLLIAGLALLSGRGISLAPGYSRLSPEARARVDAKALCRSMGRTILLTDLCLTMLLTGLCFGLLPLAIVGGAALAALPLTLAIRGALKAGKPKE